MVPNRDCAPLASRGPTLKAPENFVPERGAGGRPRLVSDPRPCSAARVQIITGPIDGTDGSLPEIAVRVDRATLGRRSWRASADDGKEFGFELVAALRHGSLIFRTTTARYVIAQRPEPLLEISLELAPSAAAGIGWAIGNAHLELSAEPLRMLTPDLPETRALLERLQVRYAEVSAVFRSGRFARAGQPARELGAGHRHAPGSSTAQ